MTLVISATSKPTPSSERRAIGICMLVRGTQPTALVCVFVTYEALRALDPSKPPDLQAAFEIFDACRQKIEIAASHRFDAQGVDDDDLYEGQSVITLRDIDLI